MCFVVSSVLDTSEHLSVHVGASAVPAVNGKNLILNCCVLSKRQGGAPDEALKLLHGMEKAYGVRPGLVSYNSAISALSKAGRAREAK